MFLSDVISRENFLLSVLSESVGLVSLVDWKRKLGPKTVESIDADV